MHPEPLIVKVGPRELAVEDAGPDSGFPILMMNGAGSRHLFPPAVREGQEQGFRLIGYDRPGCGGSTSLPGRRIADCAGDIRTIMCELSISRAAVWGSSGGGHMRWPLRRSCRRSLPPERARAEFRKRSAVTLAERGPWQFDLADIQAPVRLWHGLKDFLPVSHARWLADRIPSVVTHFPPDEDHSNVEENNRAAAFSWLKASVC